MTNEEAVTLLEATRKMTEGISDLHKACKVAIEALEKQIPMKPSSYKGFVFECPKCEEPVGKNVDRYCPWCGQKIDWSES